MGKLLCLGELVKRKILFDNRPVEIAELSSVIKQDLAGLQHQVGALQQLQRRSGTAGGRGGRPTLGIKGGGGGSNSREGEHNKNVALLHQGKLADVGENSKDVLEIRTENNPGESASTTPREERIIYSLASPPHFPWPDSQIFWTNLRRAQGLLPLDPSTTGSSRITINTYTTQRGRTIEAIERNIANLGGILGQLAQMVSNSEQVHHIDANTDDVVYNVDGAQRELMKQYSDMLCPADVQKDGAVA
ncbi:hypothetical protein LTR62_002364 [Meristemomyces frigidus]|uniref:t-SNARE coiled-coil homology domain-containing protein n=1 Tax=Meristemomyces frigidus TaxID=1508187 RepID=A0AAN7YFT9_9PEZI|nr:hypothetical protein LTR62_002364 [Meristemomyces frigidus]